MAVGKKELVSLASEKTGATKKATAEQFDAIVESVQEYLADGQDVSLAGLVSFKNEFKPAHKRTVHFSGQPEEIDVDAKTVVKAKASKTLQY